ncbi:hypothetical protein WDL1P2_00388 (plasmid) [Variovorax sp. WDL1]|nr:hypothetical protein APY03_6604 [Variovorax sp. WDL1]PNG49215.1 hypothetical protein CHC06_06452 [Variovorax sp. B2]PNG49600.1 hypothetical protein CHC07_06509 [Variovorax sp. B4]VTV18730.1 hypothetical protein WDL1P2_00388 [Variovorax sp. WDL1]
MKLTQAELAQKLDIPLPEYRRLEHGDDELSVRYVMRLLLLAQMNGWEDVMPEDLCDDETAAQVQEELNEFNFVGRLMALCDSIDVLPVMCEVHGWHEAPHAHMDADSFLETLAREAEMVTAVFIDVEEIDMDAPLAEIMGTIGLPWPDFDEVPEKHQEAFRHVEAELRAAFLEERPTSDWIRTEAVYDTGGGLLRATSVMAPWYDDLRDSVLSWLDEHRDQFLAMGVDVDTDPEEPITRH